MATQWKLTKNGLRWAAVAVALIASLGFLSSNLGPGRDNHSDTAAFMQATIGPLPVKVLVAIAVGVIVALIYLSSRRPLDNSN